MKTRTPREWAQEWDRRFNEDWTKLSVDHVADIVGEATAGLEAEVARLRRVISGMGLVASYDFALVLPAQSKGGN